MNLTKTYVEMKLSEQGVSKTRCAVELAHRFDRKYSLQKINSWRRGDEQLPKKVRDHMLKHCLAYAIKQSGGHLDKKVVDKLIIMIT